MRRLLRVLSLLHGTVTRALRHDCLNLAQSTAYSAMVALFPALIVAAAVVSLLPQGLSIRLQLAVFFDRILPPDVIPLLEGYFVASPNHIRSTHALGLAFLVSLSGASSVLATLMEGVRRANDLEADCWTFFQRRLRALLLVPLSLIPFAAASMIVVFGHFITLWLGLHVMPSVRTPVYVVALLLRWGMALAGSTGIIAMIFYLGTPLRQPWRRTLPGAVVSTAMWFFSTLVFGWYVTRFANYSQVYGSLGAGIALLFWLYIISLSILCGAEFNAEICARFFSAHGADRVPLAPNSSSGG